MDIAFVAAHAVTSISPAGSATSTITFNPAAFAAAALAATAAAFVCPVTPTIVTPRCASMAIFAVSPAFTCAITPLASHAGTSRPRSAAAIRHAAPAINILFILCFPLYASER